MSDFCGVDHPDLPISCEYREDPTKHEEHMGFHDGELVEWPNDGYTVQKVSNPKNNASRLATAANRVHDRERPIVRTDDPANSHVAAERIHPKRGSRKSLVLEALRSAGGDGWVDGTALETPEVGGSQGTRRLRELRADGWAIEARPHPTSDTAWQYRLSNPT